MNGRKIMSYSVYICSGLVVLGLFLIFISGSFSNAVMQMKDQRLGFFRSLFNQDWSESEKKIRKKSFFLFFIGLSLLFIAVFAGIFLQKVP